MRRIMLVVTVALVMAAMIALPGAALANHGAAHGGGGHVGLDTGFYTFTGGTGGSDKGGGGGGGHTTIDFAPFLVVNVGAGGGGSEQGSGGGGGGCVTVGPALGGTGERECGSLSRILN